MKNGTASAISRTPATMNSTMRQPPLMKIILSSLWLLPLRRDPTLHTKKPRQHCTNRLRHEDMDFALIESTGSINKPLLKILDIVLSSVTEPIIGAKNIWRTGFAKGIKG